jgi:putative glutamine amidotransferase
MSTEVLLDEVLPAGPAPASPRARIGVVAPLNFPDMTEEIAALVRELISVTLRTLWELDAEFELLDPSVNMHGADVPENCNGLLLLGGGDIDPSCYTTPTKEMPGSYGIDIHADKQSLALIEEAEERDLPILGICRGHQLLNVYRGGTIIADIDDPQHIHHGGPGAPFFVTEEITLLPDSRIRSIYGESELSAWAAHHQAVEALGKGLVVSARAADGGVEAIEDPKRWLLGVQWHPEREVASADDRRKLFGALIDACASNDTCETRPRISAEHG